MATKNDVKTFITKVEYKAGKSVDDRYHEDVESEITKLIELDPQLKTNIANAEKCLRSLVKVCKSIQGTVTAMGDIGGNKWDTGLTTLINDIDRAAYQDFTKASFRNIVPVTPELKAVNETYQAEKKSVKEAYKSLTYNADHMTPTKAIKYLASVGFDTAWFGENHEIVIKEVDPTQLFVCGEKS